MTKLSKGLPLGKLPEPLGDMPGLVFKDRFYVFGGGCEQEIRDVILTVDASTGECEPSGKMPYPTRGHQVVLLDEKVYLLGGFDGNTKDECWRLDLEAGTAEQVQPMPASNAWFAATAHNGTIVVIGGFSIPNGYLDQMFIYDPKKDKWLVQKEVFDAKLFPKGKLGSNTVLSDGKSLFSFGGADEFDAQQGRANALSLACRYSMGEQSWEALPQQIHPREGLVAAQRGDTAYLIGGMAEGADEPSTVVEEVNLATGNNCEIAKLSTGRRAPAVGIVGNRLIVAGGVIKPLYGMTDSVEYLEIKAKQ